MKLRSGVMSKWMFLLVIVCGGCTNTNRSNAVAISNVESDLRALKSDVDTLRSEVDLHEDEILNLKLQFSDYAYFESSSTGFEVIHTNNGMFYVSLQDIKPYADGYKIRISVGNPMFATYSNLKAIVTWSLPDYRKPLAERKNVKEKFAEQTINTPLKPGTWNAISLVMAPASKEEIEKFKIKLDTPRAALFVK